MRILRKSITVADLKKNVYALRSDSTELANIHNYWKPMKKQSKSLTILLFTVLLMSYCNPPDPLPSGMPYRIKNESGVDLKIIFYNNHKTYFDSIFLFNGKYSDEFTLNEETGFYLLGRADSVDFISYSNKILMKRYRYLDTNNGKSPYNIEYYLFKDTKYSDAYIYLISLEDFK